MYFNENKSNVLLLTTKTSGDNRTQNIYLHNKRLEQVFELKYLGTYFDSRFSFDRHEDYITGKCTPIINMLAKSAKLKWGLGHRALKVLVSFPPDTPADPIRPLNHTRHMPSPSHSSRFYHPHNIG